MKKRIAAVLAVVLALSLMMGTVAYAGNGNGEGSQPTDKGQPTNRAMERWQFMEQAGPLLHEIADNRLQIRTMREELATLRLQVREHLGDLKADPESLTDEQIQLLKRIRTRLHECRDALGGTNGNMVHHRHALRQMRKSRNYEDILAAYVNVIAVQEERIQQLSDMIGICRQILDIG